MSNTDQEQILAKITQSANDFNVMKMRLDTQPLLDQLELFLRGARQVIEESPDKSFVSKKLVFGDPLANDIGIQEIMSWASILINPQTVQGNFPVDKHGFSSEYAFQIKQFRENFGFDLLLNIYEWGVKEEQAMGIIDRVCMFVEIFLSRCIGDRERVSYSKTMESKEVHAINPKIPLFKQ